MMEFIVKDTLDPSEIQNSCQNISEELIFALAREILPHVEKLKPRQFLFLMANLSSKKSLFLENLKIIDKYLSNITDLNLILEIENALYSLFLKNYEQEDCYNDFFKIIGKQFSSNLHQVWQNKKIEKVLFFIHSPVFLAHTNPMLKMLANRVDRGQEIAISSLSYDKAFAETCERIGVKFIVLGEKTTIQAYRKLINEAKSWDVLVWQCLPVHLNFICKHVPNLVWWSHKFHPGIEDVAFRIGADPNHKKSFSWFGYDWTHFDVGFDIKNEGQNANEWHIRKNYFGSFCREELIDHEKHWINVREVLKAAENLQYVYTGRKKIHQKWCENLNIDARRIKYLGWLTEPHEEIRKVNFLIDGPYLGHGLMALEAIACGVPIISAPETLGAFKNFLTRNYKDFAQLFYDEKTSILFFNQKSELIEAVKILSDQERNLDISAFLKKLWEFELDRYDNFEDFLRIINSKDF